MIDYKMDVSSRARLLLTLTPLAALWMAAASVGATAVPGSVPTTTAPGAAPTTADAPVRRIQIPTDDAQLGRMVFSGLAAGDPAAAGRGRLVLLLHGFPASSETFRAILPRLAAAGYYAVAPNLRGSSPGARPTAPGAYDVREMVADPILVAAALGAPRFHLLGHDWGGGLAWATARVYPERVASLTVLSTPHPDALADAVADPRSRQRTVLREYLKLMKAPRVQYLMLAAGPGLFGQTLRLMGLPAAYARTYAYAVRDPRVLALALRWYHDNPLPPITRLGPVAVPTQLIWGTKEFAFTRDTVERTAQHVSGPYRLVVLPGEGHFIPENVPERVAALELEMLAATSD